MSYKAIYAYAWDLAEAGIQAATAEFRSLGLDTVSVAGSYHAGKFLRPHGSASKVYFPEDGTVYFTPDFARYGAITPLPNTMLAERDMVRELTDAATMATNVWLVLLHNTPLGMAHPQAVVRNAFGDPYYYSLCPSSPDTRAFARALVADVTENYPVSGVTLETPGFMAYRHGFHHEFALMALNPWLENHLGLCFCEHCIAGAEKAGIDARRLKARVAADIESYLASDIDLPTDMAESFWRADVAEPDLAAYVRFRQDVVTSLVAEIRAAVRAEATVAVIPSLSRPTAGAWYDGSDLAALAGAGAIIEPLFYEQTAMRVKSDLFDTRRRLGAGGRLRAIVRPYHPDGMSKGEFLASVAALREGGVEGIGFYNWGHLRRSRLDWIGEALGMEAGNVG